MALPTNLTANTLRQAQSGIVVGMTPSTGSPRFRTELQISTQSSTASTNWQSVFLNPTTAQYQYTFLAPLSTRTFYFRARHLLDGYSNGPFTGTVNAKPGLLPIIVQPLFPLLNSKSNVEVLGGDLWLSSGKTAKVGTQQTTGTITKYLLVPFTGFNTINNTATYAMSVSHLAPGTINTATSFFSAIDLPSGARATSFAIRVFRENTTDLAKGNFIRSQGDVFATSSTATQASTGWATVGGSTFVGLTISTAFSYAVRVILTGKAASSNARLAYARIKYTMPSYDRAI